jgi:hypothetical protein
VRLSHFESGEFIYSESFISLNSDVDGEVNSATDLFPLKNARRKICEKCFRFAAWEGSFLGKDCFGDFPDSYLLIKKCKQVFFSLEADKYYCCK